MGFAIDLNGQQLSATQIRKARGKTPFEQRTLSFIQDWLSGTQHFTQSTSGSTGTPKAITISRDQMAASATLTIAALQLNPSHISLLCLDPAYIAGKMMIVRSIQLGMQLIAVEPNRNPLTTQDRAIDFAAFTPMQAFHILQDDKTAGKLDLCKKIILGGGAVSSTLERNLQSVQAEVYNTYGMTETVSHIALKRLNGPDRTDYFQVLGKTQVSQDDHECLVINGAVTDYKEVVTNDRVQLIDPDKFIWLGRIDNVINSGGVKIQSEQVEQKIESIFNTLQVPNRYFIYGKPHDSLGEQVTLYVEGSLDKETHSRLSLLLKETLPTYEKPKEILFIEAFAETPTGKINRMVSATRV